MGYNKKPYKKIIETKATAKMVANVLKPAVKIAESKELPVGTFSAQS